MRDAFWYEACVAFAATMTTVWAILLTLFDLWPKFRQWHTAVPKDDVGQIAYVEFMATWRRRLRRAQ